MKSKHILINLKRFDISRTKGGVCQYDNPNEWIENVIVEIVKLNLANNPQLNVSIFIPDILFTTAQNQLNKYPKDLVANLSIGSQSCHSEDVSIGGNFGAFSSFNLATTQETLGSTISIIGHCEERRHLNHVLQRYCAEEGSVPFNLANANKVVSRIVNDKVVCALSVGMKVTVCIGETAEERGTGTLEQQIEQAKKVLKSQIINSLSGSSQIDIKQNIILAYEPVWAIGPGKTPPNKEYIEDISLFIKEVVESQFSAKISVVYGGGLKYENAAMLASIPSLDGGLIALTNFTPPIGFQTDELQRILTTYLQN